MKTLFLPLTLSLLPFHTFINPIVLIAFFFLSALPKRCAQNTDSKATILRKAVDYILQLEDEIRRYAEVYPPPPLSSLPPTHPSYPTHNSGNNTRVQVPYDDSDS